MIDKDYMKIALDLALQAKGKTWPNPMVGALIVKNNRIIARGLHRYCGGDHAEVVALKKAGKNTKGAKLYVTLEPCSHFGRTPPCVERIIQSAVKEVIIGMVDPNPVNNGKSVLKLKRAGIKVKVGFLKEELQKINEPFIKYITKKMPFVVAKIAQTLDGKSATQTGESKWITSEQTRDYTHKLRNDFSAICVGINTVLKDDPSLNAPQKSKQLKKIVIDSTLRIPLKARLFQNTNPTNIIIATTKRRNRAKENILRRKGIQVLIGPSIKEGVNLKWLFRNLAKKEISYVLIEGGAKVIGSALKAKLVDKVLLAIAPKILGDEKALGSVCGLQIKWLKDAVHLKNVILQNINNDILVEGYVYGNR